MNELEKQYHLVAHLAPFTGLPSIGVFTEEKKASVRAQVALACEDFGKLDLLIESGPIGTIKDSLKKWTEDHGFEFVEIDTENKMGFSVKVP